MIQGLVTEIPLLIYCVHKDSLGRNTVSIWVKEGL